MTKKNNPHTLLKVVLLVAFVAVAIWYSLVIPPGEGVVGLGAVALWAVYHAIQLLFPEHPWAPLGATALLGFNPSLFHNFFSPPKADCGGNHRL